MLSNIHMQSFDSFDNATLIQTSSRTGIESNIASVLGWAVQRNIPFQEALTVLSERKQGITYDFWMLFFNSYEARISFAIIELEKGKTLSFALKKHLSKYLSPYYLAAVKKAEEEGKLAEILPQLAENIKFTSGVKDQFKTSVTYPAFLFTFAAMFLFGLYIFVIPKFEKIFAELLGGMALPPLTQFAIGISNLCIHNFIFNVLIFFIQLIFLPVIVLHDMQPNSFILNNPIFVCIQIAFIIFIAYLFYRFISKWYKSSSSSNKDVWLYIFLTGLGIGVIILPILLAQSKIINIIFFGIFQIIFLFLVPYFYFKIIYAFGKFVISHSVDILIHLPFIGKQVKKIGLLELSGAMATLTGAGYDVLEAAKWNSDTVSGHWLRKKIGNFVKSVESGEKWSDAWEAMHLGSPAHNWIVRNAASRENPYEGFKMLSTWLRDEINSQTNISMRFVEVFCIFFNAIFIGITIFAIWQCLWTLIYYVSEF